MKTQNLICALSIAVVGACSVSVDQVQPVVSQFNGDSVSVQLNGGLLEFASADVRQEAFRKADAEAQRICAKGHRKKAEFTSTRNIPTGQYSYQIERLYLCL